MDARMMTVVGGLAALVLGAAPAAGEEGGAKKVEAKPAKASAPRPAEEIARLGFLVGHWRCTGRNEAFGETAAHDFRATLRIRSGMKGHGYEVDYDERNPVLPLAARGFIAFNAADAKLWFAGYDNAGGMMEATAPPATDTLAWEGIGVGAGPDGPVRMKLRFPWTKKSEREMTIACQVEMDGAWKEVSQATCRR